jgi:flavin-dependent dehydrogenase
MTAPDVVVVGGGPIGLAAAIASRRRGLEVLVADRAHPPIDKPCGEGVMPDGVAALSDLGALSDSAPALPFFGIRFTEAGYTVDGHFGGRFGIGIRRTVLHQCLIDRAREIGVVMRWGESVRSYGREQLQIGGNKVLCRWVVGADGRESSIRRWKGFPAPEQAWRRVGFRQHFRVSPWTNFVEVHWHDLGQAVITPVAPDEICVSLFTNHAGSRISDLMGFFPELGRRLSGAEASSPARGAAAGSSIVRKVVRDRVALIGDAAGAVDALTGEGLSLGFRHAIVLGDALAQNSLQSYERAHRSISRIPELMAKLMLAVGTRRVLRRRVLRALAVHSRLFTFLLGVHTRTQPLSATPIGAIVKFPWQLLTTPRSIAEGPVAK